LLGTLAAHRLVLLAQQGFKSLMKGKLVLGLVFVRKFFAITRELTLTPYSLGLSATSQQYFSLRINQSQATNQQYFSIRTNQHQSSATSQMNILQISSRWQGNTKLAEPSRSLII
jgi:hypothetical protein